MATADTREIFKRMDAMSANVAEILGEQKAQKERWKVVDKHELILHGNGSEGLVTAMATVKTSVDGFGKSQDKTIRWLRRLALTIFVTGASLIGTILTVLHSADGAKAEPASVAIDHHDHDTPVEP